MSEPHPGTGIFSTGNDFAEMARQIFLFQYNGNPVYKKFADLVNRTPFNVREVEMIPFLPAGVFRTRDVITCGNDVGSPVTFRSSGTGLGSPAIHTVTHPEFYRQSFIRGFERVFGDLTGYSIFALLPNYLEQGSSSLVYMVDNLIRATGSEYGGFFINDHQGLFSGLVSSLKYSSGKTMLIGVTYALVDFIESLKSPLPDITLVETGGMKGRGKEMIREELYDILRRGYGVKRVYSEYGMTELCSQAWSSDNGLYYSPPWMKVLIRDLNDPFRILPAGKRGAINIIDLANLYSCAFIATDDIGKVNPDGSFEVLGRVDGSEQRGCNLLISW